MRRLNRSTGHRSSQRLHDELEEPSPVPAKLARPAGLKTKVRAHDSELELANRPEPQQEKKAERSDSAGVDQPDGTPQGSGGNKDSDAKRNVPTWHDDDAVVVEDAR